jgi:uncharacterized membrane protein YdjX (TVP38/TMEM64 family)
MSGHIEMLSAYVQSVDPLTAGLVLIAAKTIGGLVGVPGTPLTLITGALLGPWWGTLVALVGNSLGALAAFALARTVGRTWVQTKLLPKYPALHAWERALFTKGLYTVLFMRLVPLFPFNALNFLLGVTEVRTRDYVLGTVVGIIPGTFLFVYFGDSLAMFSYVHAALGLLGILGLSAVGYYAKNNFLVQAQGKDTPHADV